jgi:hypothetical protein
MENDSESRSLHWLIAVPLSLWGLYWLRRLSIAPVEGIVCAVVETGALYGVKSGGNAALLSRR